MTVAGSSFHSPPWGGEGLGWSKSQAPTPPHQVYTSDGRRSVPTRVPALGDALGPFCRADTWSR